MRLWKRTATLLTGESASRALGILTFAIMARVLGLSDFGVLSFAFNAALITAVFVDMGQNVHVCREASANSDSVPSLLSKALMTKAALTLLAACFMASFALLTSTRTEAFVVGVLVMWAGALSMVDTLRAIARSAGLFRSDSVASVAESTGRLVAAILAALSSNPILVFCVLVLVEVVITGVMYAWYLSRSMKLWGGFASLTASLGMLRVSAPVGVSALVLATFYRVDQVLLRALAGTEATGQYGAAARIVFAGTAIGVLVSSAAFPELARTRDDAALFGRAARHAFRLAIMLASVVTIVVAAAASPIVLGLYGSDYLETVPLVRVLAIVVAINSVTVVAMYSANALGREKSVLLWATVGVALNFVADLFVIPAYGALGAAWVSVAGELLLATALLFVIRDKVFDSIGTTRPERVIS